MRGRVMVAIVLTAILLVGGLATGAYAYGSHLVYQVTVDGKAIGLVADAGLVDEALNQLGERMHFPQGMDATPDQTISTSPVHKLFMPPVLDQTALVAALSPLVTFHATGAAIVVDGKPVVWLASMADAQTALQKVQQDFQQTLDEGDVTVKVLDLHADQKVAVEKASVGADQLVDVARAVAILERGTDVTKTYKVQGGDSLWKIASTNHMTESQLRQANPQVKDPTLLHPGDELNLVVPTPYITYSAELEVTFEAHIPYDVQYVRDDSLWPWQRKVIKQGEEGDKRVTERIVRDGTQEVSRDVEKTEVLKEPVTAVVALGSKAVPDQGTGSFEWPIADGGVITSPFGARGAGYHYGVDIGVPLGTPVHAADSGTVIFAAWDGGYGRLIEIDHGGGKLVTMYAHLSKFLVSPGDVVKRGQVIGLSGSTGNSTGPHLHFQVMQNGKPVNPLNFFK